MLVSGEGLFFGHGKKFFSKTLLGERAVEDLYKPRLGGRTGIPAALGRHEL